MRLSTLSGTALVSVLALAQNDTDATNTTVCSRQSDMDRVAAGTINSTGTASFTWNTTFVPEYKAIKPWYMSILVNDTLRGRNGNNPLDNRGTIAWPYLSVPNDVHNAKVCVYQFPSQNATSLGSTTGSIGCVGVLPRKCTEYLWWAIQNQTSGIWGEPPSCLLPPTTPYDLKLREEACGALEGPRLATYQVLGNDTCGYPSLPGVDIPDNYTTRRVGTSLSPFNASADARWGNYNAMAYDLSVVQSTPFAVVSAFNFDNAIEKDVQFVCVTPNNTQPSSRVPENKAPWGTADEKTSGAHADWNAAGRLRVVMAGVMGLMLIL